MPPTRSRAAILNHDKILSLLRQSIKRFCLLLQGLRSFFTSTEIVIRSLLFLILLHLLLLLFFLTFFLHSSTTATIVFFISTLSRLVWCCGYPFNWTEKTKGNGKINTPLISSLCDDNVIMCFICPVIWFNFGKLYRHKTSRNSNLSGFNRLSLEII